MERLRTIFDGMFDGVWLVGGDGRTTYANDAIAGMLGTTAAAMHGRPITDFLSEEFRTVARTMIANQRDSQGERVDLRFLRTDGRDLWALVAASPIVTADGAYVGSMLNVSDVTGKRAAQNQALQSQKLEAVGEFAAGISHDFNNLLTSIRGFAELARSTAEEDGSIQADLDQVIASADRARAITNKLLAFTRRDVMTMVPVDPAQVIGDMLPILRPMLSDDVQVVLEAERGRTLILVDPVALEQVLVNLAVNAHDAMHDGGQLTITIDEVQAHGRQALGADKPRPASVRLRFRDTGRGMDETTTARVFDPFFTTKEAGKGTGLGLSTVYGLIRQMAGSIHVESDPGVGTTFTILLPKFTAAPAAPHAEVVTSSRPDVGMILMVEDEPSVREYARRVLVRAGHTVLAAGSASEALAAAESWSGTIDVLLSDVMMPGARGPALAAKLRAKRPGIGVIYMSGYSADTLPGTDDDDTSAAFLPKPFTAATLLSLVAKALEEAHPAS